jgi:hypothetical protein
VPLKLRTGRLFIYRGVAASIHSELHRMGRHIYRLITQCNHIYSARFVTDVFVYGVGVGQFTVLAIWCRPVHCIGKLV